MVMCAALPRLRGTRARRRGRIHLDFANAADARYAPRRSDLPVDAADLRRRWPPPRAVACPLAEARRSCRTARARGDGHDPGVGVRVGIRA